MKGTILDLLKLAAEKPELAKELVELAGRFDFEFTDEVSDGDLDSVAGGLSVSLSSLSVAAKGGGSTVSAFPDVCETPGGATQPGVPIPYPTIGEASDDPTTKETTKS